MDMKLVNPTFFHLFEPRENKNGDVQRSEKSDEKRLIIYSREIGARERTKELEKGGKNKNEYETCETHVFLSIQPSRGSG
jgi:hypothetical protein